MKHLNKRRSSDVERPACVFVPRHRQHIEPARSRNSLQERAGMAESAVVLVSQGEPAMRNAGSWCLVLSLLSPLAATPAEDREHEALTGASKKDQLYALGAILGQKISGYGFTSAERARIQAGFADAIGRKKLRLDDPDLEEWGARVDRMLSQRANPKIAATKEKGRVFAAGAAREPDAAKLSSGVVVRTLRPGTGKAPTATSKIKVSYVGKLIDGTRFDSSVEHGGPAQFPLNGVIPCWTEGVQKMREGGKARLVCPSSVAYGDQGRPPNIPGGATLVFEIELLGVD
jgi:FKBP-type peptidyl-prolyl cis-trans isomerase FkpA